VAESSNIVDLYPAGDTDAAVNFLLKFDPDGYHNLVAIHPDTSEVVGVTAHAYDRERLRSFIAKYNSQRNIYYSVNEPNEDAPNKKLAKTDYARIRAVFADYDPRSSVETQEGGFDAERKRLLAQSQELLNDPEFAPTFVVDSGNGNQAVWKLHDPVDAGPNQAQAEAQGRGLAQKLGADTVQNIDRIFRLPGTINLPDKKKRRRGRTISFAKLVQWTDRTHSLNDLARFAPPAPPPSGNDRTDATPVNVDMDEVRSVTDYDDLPQALRIRFEAALETDDRLKSRWEGSTEGLKDESKSGLDFSLAHALITNGFSQTEVGQILWIYPHGRGGAGTADERHIKRCIARNGAIAPTDPADEFEPVDPADLNELFGLPVEEPRKPLYFIWPRDMTLPEEKPILVDDLLTQGMLSVLFGDSNTGKTFVALDIAAHIAAGRPWGGREVHQGLVVYIAAEAGTSAQVRVLALKQRMGVEDFPLALVPCPVNLLDPRADVRTIPELVREAERACGMKCVLIVIDTLSRAFAGGKENASEDMGAFVTNVDALRTQLTSAVMIVHHSGKNAAMGARGHSLLRAATDTELEVVAEGLELTAKRTVTATKQRDAAGGGAPIEFMLNEVLLGVDKKGRELKTCTIVLRGDPEWEFAQSEKKAERTADLTPEESRALSALEMAVEDVQARVVEGDRWAPMNLWAAYFEDSSEVTDAAVGRTPKTLSALGPANKKWLSRARDELVVKGLIREAPGRMFKPADIV